MNLAEPPPRLEQADQEALVRAVRLIEQPGFAARVAEMAGEPIGQILNALPKFATARFTTIVTAAVLQSLKIAISTLGEPSKGAPSAWIPKMMAGVTGGVGGLFGFASLAIELPLTTTLMLRAISDIARSEGEDLRSARSKLACLEVFALGAKTPSREVGTGAGYYAARAMLAQALNEAASYLVQRGAVDQAAPVLTRLVGTISSEFGLVVSEKVAAGAIPVVGALGGATVNVVFMDHFQNLARAHFIIRRLERNYGAQHIRLLSESAVY
jgi:hypothetical protein